MSVLGRNSEVCAVSDPFLPRVWSGAPAERKRQPPSGLTTEENEGGGGVGAGSSQLEPPQIAPSPPADVRELASGS